MTREEDQKQFAKGIWCDSYNFYLKYHGKAGTSEMWSEAVKEFEDICAKYKGEAACVRLMMTALSLLEEETR